MKYKTSMQRLYKEDYPHCPHINHNNHVPKSITKELCFINSISNLELELLERSIKSCISRH